MASENSDLNIEQDGDLHLDANLDDLSLDDDELFADLDNEVRLDGDVDASTDTADTADAGGDIDLGEDISLGIEKGEAPSNGNGSGGGGDLDLSGDLSLDDDLDLAGDVDMGADLDLSGDIDLDAGLDLDGDIDLAGDVDLGGDLDLSGDTGLPGEVDLESDPDPGGDVDLGENLDADLDLGGDLEGDLDLDVDAAPQATEDMKAGGDELDLGGDLDGDLELGGDADPGEDLEADLDLGGELEGDLDLELDAAPQATEDTKAGGDELDLGGDLDGDLELGGDADLGGDLDPGSDAELDADLDLHLEGDLDLDEDTAAGASIMDEELHLPEDTPGLEATEDAGDGEFGMGSDIDLEAELDVSIGGERDPVGDELEMDDLFELKEDSPTGAVESPDAGKMDLDELSDVDLEAPEDPELTFGEEEDGVDVDDLDLDGDPEEEDEILSVAADDLELEEEPGLEEKPFEAALDVDLDDLDLDEEVKIEPSPAPGGAQDGDAMDEDDPEFELEPMEEVSLDDEPFEAVPDVQVGDADLESLGDLEPTSLGMDDPFQSALEEDSISFEEATDVGEWDDGGNNVFTAVPDVKIHEEEVIELNLDDLDRPTTLGGMTPRSVNLPMETSQGPPSVPRMPAPPVSDPNAAVDTSILMSIPRKLNVEMGQVSLNGNEIMELSYGSIVQLSRTVGDPVELVLEGRPIARGEIVLINGKNLGVRILSLNK